jgi:spore coat protein U-like protein
VQRRQALIVFIWLLVVPVPGLGNGEDCTCSPSSTTINFGAYDVLSGAPLDSAGSFSVTCRLERGGNRSTRVSYTARLATAPARQLAPPAGSDRLTYNVYVDAARTQPWGDGTGGTFTIAGEVNLSGRSSVTDGPRNYYGRIAPGGQDVSAASPGPPPTAYGQTLTISVTCRARERDDD